MPPSGGHAGMGHAKASSRDPAPPTETLPLSLLRPGPARLAARGPAAQRGDAKNNQCRRVLATGLGRVMVKCLVRWMAVVFWMGVIFALSATPSLASPFEPVYDFILRKLAHLTVFAVLTVLLVRAFRLHVARSPHAWLFAVLVAVLYACSDEWHQTFVPGREGTVRDIVIDSLGVVGVWVLASRTCIKAMLPRWLAEEA
jgi:VanZ family protein